MLPDVIANFTSHHAAKVVNQTGEDQGGIGVFERPATHKGCDDIKHPEEQG
jgi:hypothetical protein